MRQSCLTDVAMLSDRDYLHRRPVTLVVVLPDATTGQKLKEMRIMSVHKQLGYNKGLFMYRDLNDESVCVYIYITCAHTLPHAIPTLQTITVVT